MRRKKAKKPPQPKAGGDLATAVLKSVGVFLGNGERIRLRGQNPRERFSYADIFNYSEENNNAMEMTPRTIPKI